jgi:hypothetical protein
VAPSDVVSGGGRPVRDAAAELPLEHRWESINRTRALVLGFFVVAWMTLAAILVGSQTVREVMLGRSGTGLPMAVVFLTGLSGFLVVLGSGAALALAVLAAPPGFATGLIRVPLAALQLSGRIPFEEPRWYVALQGVSGLVQAGLAVVMVAGLRRAGPWGA